ncbi:hypothetical protein F5884DRAFT_859021 [Xylogone sp. PMI_703]|nr:hypothetical protein F5884DRAFT_859021 [Xylogone sp. PMI_703]
MAAVTTTEAASQPRDRGDNAWAYKKDVAWYRQDLSEDTIGEMRSVLERYSKIPSERVVDHIKEVRDKAWEVYPYGSVGMFGFLTLNMPYMPEYTEILDRLRTGDQKFIDVGCCFGQEIRRLVYDGVPSENLYGLDLHKGFMDIGYDLFCDKATLQSTFIAADIFDSSNPAFENIAGKIDIVHAGSFFHLFSWDEQVKAAKQIVNFLKPQLGSMLVGKHAGDINPGNKSRPGRLGSRYRHNGETWKKMWEQIGEETGTKWEVQVDELADNEYFKDGRQYGDWDSETTRRLQFCVRRL